VCEATVAVLPDEMLSWRCLEQIQVDFTHSLHA
jgi:hypothetical protein